MRPSSFSTRRLQASRRSIANLLRQMLHILAARSDPSISFLPDEQRHWDYVQRCHVEAFVDSNIQVFRNRVESVHPTSRAVSLGTLPTPLTWGNDGADMNVLYYRAHPLTLFVPSNIRNISFLEVELGLHALYLELTPLALPDLVGLHYLSTFARPHASQETLTIPITSFLTDDDDVCITDEVLGADICWADVFDDDYLLAEIQITRHFTSDNTWEIRYRLQAATRLATAP